jgi:putative transposase
VAKSHLKKIAAEALGVCRKSPYYTPKQPGKDEALITRINQAHSSHPEYGQDRMAIELKVNHKRCERVMRLYGIKPPRRKIKYHYCTESTTNHHYTNLIKDVAVQAIVPHTIWVCDTSYFKFQGKFWYLVTIMDLATRQILSAWVGRHHDAALVLQCLKQAIMTAGALPTYFHTDQGKEFMAQVVTHYLELQGVQVSVSDKASPWQNGYKESFFGRFKAEFGDINRFETDGELIEEIYSRIRYYNYDRIHTALKMPPAVYAKLISDNLSRKRGA